MFYRFKTVWSGPGGPGVSHLDCRGTGEPGPDEIDLLERNAIALAWSGYWNTLKGYLPNEWTVAVSNEYERLDDAGVLQEVGNITIALGTHTGTYTGTWAGAVGVCTKFSSDSVIGGRRVRGKTFFVPVGADLAFDSDGTLNGTALTDFNAARVTLHNAIAGQGAVPVIFSPTHDSIHDIIGFSIADRSAVLRSRRD